MSISSEISRISANVEAAKTAISSKGVTVPSTAKSDDLAALIGQIESGGSTLLTPYAIRPDAELVQRWTFDQMLVADMGVTIPAWTTSAKTLVSLKQLGTVAMAGWTDYFLCVRYLTIPEYSITTKAKGREDYLIGSYVYEFPVFEVGVFHSLDGTKSNSTVSRGVYGTGCERGLYWSSATAVAFLSSSSYGITQVIAAPQVSSTNIVVRAPSVQIRGHTTYFTQTYFEALQDARIQYVIELYKAQRDVLNVDGWSIRQQTRHAAVDCIRDSSHDLT